MEDRIKQLPEIIASQIKAGEVVESPSTALKELMENAVDAGASCIKVNYVNGGRDLLQVIDNGCGMTPGDAIHAFDTHSTSKISSFEDIYNLHTFGFRGEALASIAAISQVELLTRPSDSEIGSQTLINGGEFISQKPVTTPVGSQFLIRNLFYNTPVRRKFIDHKEATLTGAIKNEFKRVAIAHSDIEMHLMCNGVPSYILPAASTVERIVGIYGSSMRNNLLEVQNTDTSIVKITGYICSVESAKTRNNEQFLFVNGRYFQSSYLNKAIFRAYEKYLKPGTFPSFFLFLETDPEKVDVNIHARKLEVKFDDQESIWQIINSVVARTLAKAGTITLDFKDESEENDLGDVEIPIMHSGDTSAPLRTPASVQNPDYNPFAIKSPAASAGASPKKNLEENTEFLRGYTSAIYPSISLEEEFEEVEAGNSQIEIEEENAQEQALDIEETSVVGDLIMLENHHAIARVGSQVIAVDLRRARERVLYDSIIKTLKASKRISQPLFFPEEYTFLENEYSLFESYEKELKEIGFDISFEGNGRIKVIATPSEVEPSDIEESLREIIWSFHSVTDVRSKEEKMALALARNGSVRSTFNKLQARVLVEQLLLSSEHGYSPSGKRTMEEIRQLNIINLLQ